MNVEIVDENFHARFSVKAKQYRYLIDIGEINIFNNHRAYQCHYDLDIERMKEASQLLIGEHDFTSFNTSPLELYPDQVRTIYRIEFVQKGRELEILITGDGFLRNMVRIIVGCLVDIGRGKRDKRELIKMLEEPSKHHRRYNITADGLYLVEVYY